MIPVSVLVLFSAILGWYYIHANKKAKLATKYFVYFLLLTTLVEIIGAYAPIAYFSEYKYFSFVEGTLFEENYWLYNIYALISFFIYVNYFKWHLENKLQRNLVSILLVLFVIGLIIDFSISGNFFNGYSAFGDIAGTLLVLFSISLYYYQLLTSDEILNFNTSLPFYISIGAILLHLVLTPLFIYSGYFDSESPEFVELYKRIVLFTNLLVYLLYSIGFIICLRKKDSS
jgi:hypothetical protein|tara:strand:- start:126798 stop:127487 length:690 start_codon:yes stop_codon:yes gene_type:complete